MSGNSKTSISDLYRMFATDFGENQPTRHAISLEDLAEELELSAMVEAYQGGEDTMLLEGGEGEDSYQISIHPFDTEITPRLRDKGFRLRLSMTGLDEPEWNEIYFSEADNGKLYPSGFLRPRDEHGGMIYPKLTNGTLSAYVRRLVGFEPSRVRLFPSTPSVH